jgi:hypothetical protein
VICATSETEWREAALDDFHARMGWHLEKGPLGDRVHELFLPVAP